ncbi:MAG: hypothetical protein AB7N80_11915 [Bdellovibrionales bacterium]
MNSTAPQNRTWMILHAVVALGLPIFLALVASCIKAPELKQGDLGPQASDEDLERVISKALYGIDPWKTSVGQQVVYDFNARIENEEQVRPIVRLTQTLLARVESADKKKLTLTIQSHEKDASTGQVEKSEANTDYELGDGATAMTLRNSDRPFDTMNLRRLISDGGLTQVMKFFALNELGGPRTAAERPIKKVTYHNLFEDSGIMAPPSAVQAKPNCGGVANCQMRYFQIDYDEASWYSDTEFDVRKWHFIISRDAPFMGYIFERCLASMVTGADRRYYVRQCQFTRDFSFANALPPQD